MHITKLHTLIAEQKYLAVIISNCVQMIDCIQRLSFGIQFKSTQFMITSESAPSKNAPSCLKLIGIYTLSEMGGGG